MSNMSDFVIENGVLTEYKGAGGDVVIPDGVTGIAGKAFCFSNYKNIKRIFIPASVVCIGDQSSEDYRVLWNTAYPGNVTDIDNQAFKAMFGFFDRLQSIVAPYLSLDKFDADRKRLLVCGFAVALEREHIVSEERRAEYLKYIKGQKKKLYLFAVKEPALLRLMLAEKMITDSDFNDVRQMVEAENNAELMATLLAYQQKNLKPVDIEEQFEKKINSIERQAERDISFAATGVMTIGDAKQAWQYEKKKDGKILLKGYKGTDTEVIIPAGIGKDAVTEIGSKAFSPKAERLSKETRLVRSKITSVMIPDSVKIIGESAFENCAKLVNIALPKSIKKIGNSAFEDCVELQSVSAEWKKINSGACLFRGCRNLADQNGFVTVNGCIYDYFGECDTVITPAGLNRIDCCAFEGKKTIKSVEVSLGVTEIDESAFSGCSNLTTVSLPIGLTEINQWAFESCKKLRNIDIPDSVKKIENHAFYDCPKLTIHAPAGSYAEEYAKKNNIPFEAE